MVVLPGNMKNSYPALKTEALAMEKQNDILTQCVVENTLRKKNAQSIHTKLLLQMIAKRGNILWVPSYQDEMNNVLQRTMIIGIDGGSKAGVNIIAASGTINSTFSNFAS